MNVLFAQFGPPAGGGAANNPFANPAFLAGFFIGLLACLGVLFLVYIFFLLTLFRALKRCRPENRTMEPGLVFLNLIPLFSTFWIFLTVNRIADSLANEYESRDLDDRGETYGRGVGMVHAWCGVIYLVLETFNFTLAAAGQPLWGIGCVSGPVGITGFVTWIIYWVKIAGYSSRLRDDEDGYDDRPRRRRDRRDDYDDEYEDDRPRRDDPDDHDRGDDRRRPWER